MFKISIVHEICYTFHVTVMQISVFPNNKNIPSAKKAGIHLTKANFINQAISLRLHEPGRVGSLAQHNTAAHRTVVHVQCTLSTVD